jgi:hypothetical protein
MDCKRFYVYLLRKFVDGFLDVDVDVDVERVGLLLLTVGPLDCLNSQKY